MVVSIWCFRCWYDNVCIFKDRNGSLSYGDCDYISDYVRIKREGFVEIKTCNELFNYLISIYKPTEKRYVNFEKYTDNSSILILKEIRDLILN